MSDQGHTLGQGIHIVVATPGRLIDMLEKKKFNFDGCRYMCMDEADRMIDLGFEDDVRTIMSFFRVGTILLLILVIKKLSYSVNVKLYCSRLRCPGRFKTLLSSR
jgi:superfamily II DNA/RNA helicase